MSEAERLADLLECSMSRDISTELKAAAELRRLSAELEKVRKDAERFVAFASGKANIMQSMIDTICKQQPTDPAWWRTAIDAAMKGTP